MINYLAKFTVPLVINKNKIKWNPWYLNLNSFISICRLPGQRNNLKQKYSLAIKEYVQHLDPIEGPVKMLYVIHGKDKRKFDLANVGCVVDKFVWGGVDKEYPTCDVYVLPYCAESRGEFKREYI